MMYVYSLLCLLSPFLLLLRPELGPAQGFFLIKGSFSLPLLLVGDLALGFCKVPGDLIVTEQAAI